MVALRDVGEIAGGLRGADLAGVLEAFDERFAGRDVVHHELLQAALPARLHVVRPGHHADAGGAVGEGNEPEPAVGKPEDGDVAFIGAFAPLCAVKVRVHGRAVVARVALLDLEAVGEKGVAPRGVDHEARAPLHLVAVVATRRDVGAAFGKEIHLRDLDAFVHLGALGSGVAEQDVVKVRAPDLVGAGHGLVPGIGKMKRLCAIVIGRHELGAGLVHADRLDLIGDAHLFEQRQVGRQQRFADVEAGVVGFFKHHHVVPLFGQQAGHGRAGGAAADHEHVAGGAWFPLGLWIHGMRL